MDWDDVRAIVNKLKGDYPSAVSQRESLFTIIDTAERHGLDPSCLENTSICKLCTIIHKAKIAIGERDYEYLQNLFQLAGVMNIPNLRIQLGQPDLEGIHIIPIKVGEETTYKTTLSQTQLNRIKKATKLQYHFYTTEDLNWPQTNR
jgi:hypothetical protein